MVANRAARRCTEETVVTGLVAGDAANCRAFKATFGLCRNAYGGDRQQHCGARSACDSMAAQRRDGWH